MRPDLKMFASPVSYYDPYFAKPDTLLPHVSKHFRYAYQNEFRYIWVGDGLGLTEQPFFVELGTLRDVAELFVLRPN